MGEAQRTPDGARSGTRWQPGRRGLGCHSFLPLRVGVAKCGPPIAGFTRYRNRAPPESLKTQHDSTLPPHPPPQMRNIRSQRAHARATAPPLPSPAHHMATMAKASVTSARTLNLSLVDALFECCLEWKGASSEVWQAYARWRQGPVWGSLVRVRGLQRRASHRGTCKQGLCGGGGCRYRPA